MIKVSQVSTSPAGMEKKKAARNHVFDAFRSICAILIVVGHAGVVTGTPSNLFNGAIIVDAFFLMSGFLLCQQYDVAFARGGDALDLTVKRLIRIYPIYICSTAIGLVLLFGPKEQHGQWRSLLTQSFSALLVLPSASADPSSALFPSNPPLWSLMWEVWLNVAFVFAWRWLRGGLLIILVLISGLVVIAEALIHGGMDFGVSWRMLVGGGARAIFAFFGGVWMARLYSSSRFKLSASGVLVLAVFLILVHVTVPRSLTAAFQLFLLLIIVPVLTWISAGSSMPTLLVPFCIFSGDLYYGIYAWHGPVLKLIRRFMDQAHLAPAAVFLLLPCVLAPAWAFIFNKLDTRLRATLLSLWKQLNLSHLSSRGRERPGGAAGWVVRNPPSADVPCVRLRATRPRPQPCVAAHRPASSR